MKVRKMIHRLTGRPLFPVIPIVPIAIVVSNVVLAVLNLRRLKRLETQVARERPLRTNSRSPRVAAARA
jgi:hypothetical protein